MRDEAAKDRERKASLTSRAGAALPPRRRKVSLVVADWREALSKPDSQTITRKKSK